MSRVGAVVVAVAGVVVCALNPNSGTSALYQHPASSSLNGHNPQQSAPVAVVARSGPNNNNNPDRGYSYAAGARRQDDTYRNTEVPTSPDVASPGLWAAEQPSSASEDPGVVVKTSADGNDAVGQPSVSVNKATSGADETGNSKGVERSLPFANGKATFHVHRGEGVPPAANGASKKDPPQHEANNYYGALEAETQRLRNEVDAYREEARAAAREIERELARLVEETRRETEAEWKGAVEALRDEIKDLTRDRDAACEAQVNLLSELAAERAAWEKREQDAEMRREAEIAARLADDAARAAREKKELETAFRERELALEERLERAASESVLVARRLDIKEVKHEMERAELERAVREKDIELQRLEARLADPKALAAALYFAVGGAPAAKVASVVASVSSSISARVGGARTRLKTVAASRRFRKNRAAAPETTGSDDANATALSKAAIDPAQ